MAKLEVLMEYGGIYLDYDVIMVRPMNELRQYDFTIGKCSWSNKFVAGIVIGTKDFKFLRLWLVT